MSKKLQYTTDIIDNSGNQDFEWQFRIKIRPEYLPRAIEKLNKNILSHRIIVSSLEVDTIDHHITSLDSENINLIFNAGKWHLYSKNSDGDIINDELTIEKFPQLSKMIEILKRLNIQDTETIKENVIIKRNLTKFLNRTPIIRWKYADLEAAELDVEKPEDLMAIRDQTDGAYAGDDRDQHNKLICVYIKDPNFDGQEADRYKDIMLNIWKSLQDEGVEFYFDTPFGDKGIFIAEALPTPFSYTSMKDFRGEHGILHEENYNPGFKNNANPIGLSDRIIRVQNANPDPFWGLGFTFDDLDKFGIIYNRNTVLKNSIQSLKQHNSSAQASVISKFLEILELDKDLNSILGQAKFHHADEICHILLERYPKQLTGDQNNVVEVEELKNLLDRDQLTEESFERIIESLKVKLEGMSQRILLYYSLDDVDKYENKFGRDGLFAKDKEDLINAIARNPAEMQRLYNRQVHIDHERLQIAKLQLLNLNAKFEPILNKLNNEKNADTLVEAIKNFEKTYSREISRLSNEGKTISDISENDVMLSSIRELDNLITAITDKENSEEDKISALRHFEKQMKQTSWQLFKNALKAILIAAVKYIARQDITHNKSEIYKFFKTKEFRSNYREILQVTKEEHHKADRKNSNKDKPGHR